MAPYDVSQSHFARFASCITNIRHMFVFLILLAKKKENVYLVEQFFTEGAFFLRVF